jgi:hypothetical protein
MTDPILQAANPDLSSLPEMPFSLTGIETAPINYADGITQVALGYPISKIFFHHVTTHTTPPEAQKEVRKVTQILSIPTVQLVEACKLILSLAKAHEVQLVQLNGNQTSQFTSLLADVEPQTPMPVRPEEQTH